MTCFKQNHKNDNKYMSTQNIEDATFEEAKKKANKEI